MNSCSQRGAVDHLAAQLLAGVAHMPGLLDDVDAGHAAHQRLHPLVREGQPLHPVEDLLAEQGAVKEPGVVETVLRTRREVVVQPARPGTPGAPPFWIRRANIFECRHSSAISVSA